MYSAVVLDKKSRETLENVFSEFIPDGWEVYCHHMTINLGRLKHGPLGDDPDRFLGKEVELKVTHAAKNEMVIAVCVTTDIPSKNKVPHITIAVNVEDGGRQKMSNDLEYWLKLNEPFVVSGTIQEVI